MLYTPIGGYTGSSTRTELAASIIAISANGPTHIGTDSQACCDKSNEILWYIRAKKHINIIGSSAPMEAFGSILRELPGPRAPIVSE